MCGPMIPILLVTLIIFLICIDRSNGLSAKIEESFLDGCRYVFIDVGTTSLSSNIQLLFLPFKSLSNHKKNTTDYASEVFDKYFMKDRERDDVCAIGFETVIGQSHNKYLAAMSTMYDNLNLRAYFFKLDASSRSKDKSSSSSSSSLYYNEFSSGVEHVNKLSRTSEAMHIVITDLAEFIKAKVSSRKIPPSKLLSDDPLPTVILKIDREKDMYHLLSQLVSKDALCDVNILSVEWHDRWSSKEKILEHQKKRQEIENDIHTLSKQTKCERFRYLEYHSSDEHIATAFDNAEHGGAHGLDEVTSAPRLPTQIEKHKHPMRDMVGTLHEDLLYHCAFNDSFATYASKSKPDGYRLQERVNLEDLEKYSTKWGMKLIPDAEGYMKWTRPGPEQRHSGDVYPVTKKGFEPGCSVWTTFESWSNWFRDFYLDKKHGTQPRMRALAFVLANFFPNWSKVNKIHESSPQRGGLSACLQRLVQEGKYLGSQYSARIKCGENIPDSTDVSVDLEKQCLDSASIDIVISQDVLEHVFDAPAVFREIARTLRPGGIHIFTVPTTSKQFPTFEAATRVDRGNGTFEVLLHAEPEVHGNPMGGGSLLVRQWGFDIVDMIHTSSGMSTYIFYVDSEILGIEDADYREVYVSMKDGMHPQLTLDFSAKIKELVSDPVVKENPELLKKNMITCNVELAQNSTRP